ncbi:LacI family DNA-binding transcriptional regulator [Occultella gossypii]|uniref:LacI family DNA-binding transcriptional regulator n=1 Tax=Occultella gossypii TaxID=2800820 RepID=A0ABS7SCL9_9MICO|nr:LacI family DNA-binding transcriptional regulator [Occultella gossypii]MBZ2198090.1 LacI family DNA-binding transcriptional regulator [Occultella gossypii]
MPSVTLSDVAREAGVSLATASRAINGSANRTVRPELRERVLAAAAALHYSPDANAQAMARGRTTTIGLIVHDIADPYFSSIAAGVTAAAEQAGLMVTLASTGHDPEREIAFIEVLQSQRARAIVMAGGRTDDEAVNDRLRAALAAYRAGGGAVAMIGQPLFDVDTVVIENAAGAADLAGALHGAGYRRFAALAGPAGHLTARDRMDGFAAGLATHDAALSPEHIVRSAFTRDGGYEGMRQLLESGAAVDVVFAVNDVMAVGAMAAARDAGVAVGTGIGIAGFDDIVTLRDLTPSLTTVRVPLLEVGTAATELTLAEPALEPRIQQVASTVVLRDSTPPRT